MVLNIIVGVLCVSTFVLGCMFFYIMGKIQDILVLLNQISKGSK